MKTRLGWWAVLLMAGGAFGAETKNSVTAADPLPVLLRAAGNWLDGERAIRDLDIRLPKGDGVTLTNVWTFGTNRFVGIQRVGSGMLFLTNVWTHTSGGVTEKEFWRTQGLPSDPIEVSIPGASGFYVPIAGGRVLPFVGCKGTMALPALWALPPLPAKAEGKRRPQTADISRCRQVMLDGGNLNISGWLAPYSIRQAWILGSEAGLLSLELRVSLNEGD